MGKKIYPTHHMKYMGCSIKEINGSSFNVIIDSRKKRIRETKRNFVTYEKALRYIRRKCKKDHLKIKNIIYDRDTHYECVLTHGKLMQFDKEDIDLVQKHIICAHRRHDSQKWVAFATHSSSGKTVNFANLLMEHEPTMITVDHENPEKGGLDNRRSNLRLASKREQAVNRQTSKRNSSGVKGVAFAKRGKHWMACWTSVEGKGKSKSFSCNKYGYEEAKKMAIDHRNKMVNELEHYKPIRNHPSLSVTMKTITHLTL
jgi:hypothetical protein